MIQRHFGSTLPTRNLSERPDNWAACELSGRSPKMAADMANGGVAPDRVKGW